MTLISIFYEYEGVDIPNLPFPSTVERAQEKINTKDLEIGHIFKTNVKVFEKDVSKREQILNIFLRCGFRLVADCIKTTLKNGIIVCSYDRLIFSSVKTVQN